MSEIDFYKRLNRLEKRRKGTDLTYNAFDSVTAGVTSFNEFDELKRTISVHDKFHRTLVLSGFFFLKIASTFLNSSFFPKPIKRRIAI